MTFAIFDIKILILLSVPKIRQNDSSNGHLALIFWFKGEIYVIWEGKIGGEKADSFQSLSQ